MQNKNEFIKEDIPEIDLSECEEIGRGQCAYIYKISEDKVVKVFFDTIPRESIIEEYKKTCEANRLGIHSVECYGLVSSAGRLGVVLEYIKGEELKSVIYNDVEDCREYGKMMAQEMKLIHSKVPDKSLFPSIHDFYMDCIDKCGKDNWITDEEVKLLRDFVSAVPQADTFIHADYHTRNIMMDKGMLRLIDMADCMSGHPIFDLLITNLYLHYIPESAPVLYDRFFTIPKKYFLDCWDEFVRTYFDANDNARISRINDILNAYTMLKLMLAPYSFSNMSKEEYANFVELGRKNLMPVIREYTGVIPTDISRM